MQNMTLECAQLIVVWRSFFVKQMGMSQRSMKSGIIWSFLVYDSHKGGKCELSRYFKQFYYYD